MLLKIIDEIKKSIDNECFIAALTLALTIPDICGKAEYPDANITERYIKWYNMYVGRYEKFSDSYGIDMPYSSGELIYNLRNSLFHQGTPNIDVMRVKEEACVLLTQKRNEKDYEFEIEVSLMIDSDRLFEDSRPTYTNIRKYVFDKYGVKLQLKDIADVKRDYGMKMKVNKHLIKGDEPVRRKCTPNKRKYIIEALKYYHAI